jgi:energy-coupling factor transporter ATP-binding protein EcfA2
LNLLRFRYWEREPSGEEWALEPLTFGKFNLVVGRNAAGKTRLLKAIARIAALVGGESRVLQRDFQYDLEIEGAGENEKSTWARLLQYLPFTGRMNLKRHKDGGATRLDLPQTFHFAQHEFGPRFEDLLRTRMEVIGYPFESVRATNDPASLAVKQRGRSVTTPFSKLSQAQQRTLTFLSIVTLLELENTSATLLVDDFAEGLDFESAIALTKLVLDVDSSLQFIVTSNDRYVMNTVPLEHWTVLVEEGQKTRAFNYENSKQKFDDFKFTGLNNFDFFSMDFARSPT